MCKRNENIYTGLEFNFEVLSLGRYNLHTRHLCEHIAKLAKILQQYLKTHTHPLRVLDLKVLGLGRDDVHALHLCGHIAEL